MYTFHLEAAAAGDDTAVALAALQAAGAAGLPAVHDLVAAIKVRSQGVGEQHGGSVLPPARRQHGLQRAVAMAHAAAACCSIITWWRGGSSLQFQRGVAAALRRPAGMSGLCLTDMALFPILLCQAAGMLAGVTIKPGTPVELLLPYIASIDMVRFLLMLAGCGTAARLALLSRQRLASAALACLSSLCMSLGSNVCHR